VTSAARLAAVALLCAGCGKKGPPLPPLTIVPARVQDVTARRVLTDVEVSFTLPSQNQDGSTPADLERVELYAISGNPIDAANRPLEGREFLRHATLVASVEVEPPPEPEAEGPDPGATAEPADEDPRPAQGEAITIQEQLTPAAWEPFVHPDAGKRRPEPERSDRPPPPRALGWPGPYEPFARTYVVVGANRRGQRGALSPRVAVPLTDPPPPAEAPEVTYTETAVRLVWQAPPGARRPVSDPPQAGELAARILLTGAMPHSYNVYTWPGDAPRPDGLTAVNPKPVEAAALELPAPRFGVAQCYAIRLVEVLGRATVEGEMSPPACHTPVDTFAPAAPRNLAAVGSEGGISLIWEANGEADLAGYLVLRSPAPGDPTEALAAEPLKETTYRDTTAAPGVRYVYVVTAVDTAGNRSAPSNTVEESAR
jgi:hypothetical protein